MFLTAAAACLPTCDDTHTISGQIKGKFYFLPFPVPCTEKTLNAFLRLDGMVVIKSKLIVSEVEDYVWQFPGRDFLGVSPLTV